MSGAGHIYVIAFSDGTVKVGRAGNAQSRMAAHRGDARKFGHVITDSWTSPLHAEWHANEDTLKKLAAKSGGTPRGSEYFTGADYAAIVSEAAGLPFTPPETEGARASLPSLASLDDLRRFCEGLSSDLRKAEWRIAELEARQRPAVHVVKAQESRPGRAVWGRTGLPELAAADLKAAGVTPETVIAQFSEWPELAQRMAAELGRVA